MLCIKGALSRLAWRYHLDNNSEDANYRVDGSRVGLKPTSLLSSSVFYIGSWSLSMCSYSTSKGGTQILLCVALKQFFSPFHLHSYSFCILERESNGYVVRDGQYRILNTRFVFTQARDAIDSALPSPVDCIQVQIRLGHQPQCSHTQTRMVHSGTSQTIFVLVVFALLSIGRG